MGRRFNHEGEEWDAESTETASGTGAGDVMDITDHGVEFVCVSNSSKGPYRGNISKPNPNEVSEEDLKIALRHAIANAGGGKPRPQKTITHKNFPTATETGITAKPKRKKK